MSQRSRPTTPEPTPGTDRRGFLAGTLAVATACVLPAADPSAREAAADTVAARLAALLDEFTRRAQREPSADLSAGAFARARRATAALLARLRAIGPRALAGDDLINYRFAESLLVGEQLEQKRRLWRMDPRVYLTFSGLSRLIDNPESTDADADRVVARLRQFPAQFADGRRNLAVNVPRFRELALYQLRSARTIFADGVPAFADRHPGQARRLRAAGARALAALAGFEQYLETRLPLKPAGDYAIGRAAYDRLLKEQYLLDYDADTLYAYGRAQFDLTVRELEAVAARIDPARTWRQLVEEIKREGPEPERMIAAHQEWVDKARAHVLDKQLVPIPWPERVEVVPRVRYRRKESYYGDFDGASAPGADGVWVGRWEINPYEPEWDEETKRQYLLEHDWGVIIDTAPHETYAGHHVQGLYQAHNPHALRRQFGISIFGEGWGLYNETLMHETGFFPNDRIHLRQLQLRLWRIARVVWDVGLHTRKLSYDECVTLLADGVGFLRWAAELEVDASATDPGYRIGYFMGASEIHRLRDEVRALRGAAFTLSDFHERLLKVGSMPPALMRAGLLASFATGVAAST
jgi:uncharacterized protein (DUF885 family)